MTGAGQQALPFEARLPEFVQVLHRNGISLTTGQQARLVAFVGQLATRGEIPKDANRLASLITSLVASTPQQQSQCRDILLGFIEPRVVPEPDPNGKDHVREKRSNWRLQLSLAHVLMGFAFIVLVSAALFAAIWLIPEPGKKPLGKGNDHQKSTSVELADISDWLKSYPIEELELPKQRPWNRSWRWFYTEYTPVKWAAAILPWIAYFGVMAWLYSLLLAYLRREALRRNLSTIDLSLEKIGAPFGDRRLLAALQPLRQLPCDFRTVLNPEGTAQDSAKAGGLFRPKFDRVPIPNDFVALIDRRSPRDHPVAYNMEIVRAFRNCGLFVEIFHFDRDASLVQSERTENVLTIEELIRRFPESVFLAFCDGELLINPVDGSPQAWAQALRERRSVAFVTSKLDGERSPVEKQLSAAYGFDFFPATPSGIAALARRLKSEGRINFPNQMKPFRSRGASGLLAAFLAERPQRWLQRVQPMGGDKDRLLDLLQRGLGKPVIRWLAGTTVYPELRWPLTLALKSATTRQATRSLDGDVLAVARLPWFRAGWMPDWVRDLLQKAAHDMNRDDARRVVLQAMGLGSGEKKGAKTSG